MANETFGGRYRARLNRDGTMDIFDVPIVSELAKGERADLPDFEITPQWLAAALNKATARYKSGYLPPLHIHHHDEGPAKPRAGFFRPTRVGSVDMDGKAVKTLFADLLRIPKPVADRIMRGELPYRSIEILNVNSEPEVDSLALLDSQPPQFRFPLLSIGQVEGAESAELSPIPQAMALPTAAVAFASFPKGGAAALFKFSGDSTMPNDLPPEDEDKKLAADAAPSTDGPPAWADALAAKIVDGVSAALEAQYTKMSAAFAPKPVEGEDLKAAEDENKAKEDEAAKAAAAASDAEATDAGKPQFVDPTIDDQKLAATIAKATSKFTGALAEAKGEITGLKAKIADGEKREAAREAKVKKDAALRAAREKLKPLHLDMEAVEADLQAMADAGEDHLNRFVAGLVKVAPEDPDPTLESFTGELRASDPAEFHRFQGSPARLAAVREIEKMWRANKAKGLTTLSLERYIACNESFIPAAEGAV